MEKLRKTKQNSNLPKSKHTVVSVSIGIQVQIAWLQDAGSWPLCCFHMPHWADWAADWSGASTASRSHGSEHTHKMAEDTEAFFCPFYHVPSD